MGRYSAKRSFSPSCSHSLHSCHSSHLRHPGYASHLHYFVTCVTSVTTVILVAFLSPLILPSFFAFATPYSPLSPQNLSPLALLLPFTMSWLLLCCIPCHIPLQALSSISSGSNTCLAIVNTIARAVAIVIVTVAALGIAVVRLSCHPCHLSFSFHPCHLPHFRYLVIRVILVIPVIVVTLSLSVMSTATVDADLDLKAALTIVHDIGWPRPTCEDPEWVLERGLQQDIPIILFTKGLGLGHEGASFFHSHQTLKCGHMHR